MKRIICMILSLTLAFGCIAAKAEESALTQKMKKVTQLVKTILDISDEYTEFDSFLNDRFWHLNWHSEDGWLDVSCLEDGTILEYNRSIFYSYEKKTDVLNARFPKLTTEELQAKAAAFLTRVICEESWGWEMESFMPALKRGYYSNAVAQGRLTYHALPTDIGFSISLDPMTGDVTSFYRYDAYTDYAPLPGDELSTVKDGEAARQQAREKLLDAYDLELVYYVTDPREMARLVYRRTDNGRIALDAKTGELLSFDASLSTYTSAQGADYGLGVEEAEDAMALRQLTETELEGIALYDEVLSASELDRKIRDTDELIIDNDYVLFSASYSIDDDTPVASLSYCKTLKQDWTIEVSFSMDARSGRILNMYSYSNPYVSRENEETADPEQQREAALRFIEKYYADCASQVRLTDSSADGRLVEKTPVFSYTFTREHAGYLFRENAIIVRIDGESGKICGFNLRWSEGQEFYEPEEPISTEDARLNWLGESKMELMYLSVPAKGERTGKTTLTLCRAFDEKENVYAVDAETGERYIYSAGEAGRRYEYTDDNNMLYADEIRRLGEYGIGLADYSFTEKEHLYAKQIMILSLQAAGLQNVESMSDEQLRSAFRNNIGCELAAVCTDAPYTRGLMLRVLVEIAGYGNAARLQGIWTT